MEEKELIKQCIENNPRAQRKLFDGYYNKMYHTAMRYLNDHFNAEHVVTASFTKVFRSISKFEYRGDDSLRKWITTIVINDCIRNINSRKPLQFEPDMTVIVDKDVDVDLDANLDVEMVMQIIENMPPGYRTIFNLFAIEGYKHTEIAEMLQVSVNTSKSQLKKAREYIINEMNKQ